VAGATTRTVAVIGGGIAGLSAAWELSGTPDPGVEVIVFEEEDTFGGKLRTGSFGGRPVELGPDAFVARRPEALALCGELGLSRELVAPGVRGASVWARGRLRPLPEGLALGVPTRLGPLARSGICSPAGLVAPALDLLAPLRRGSGPSRGPSSGPVVDRAVGEVVRRHLGAEVTNRLAAPLIGGIHAGSVETMSAAAVFPALLEADGRGGSLMRALGATLAPGGGVGPLPGESAPVFLSVRGGFGRLVETLVGALRERKVDLRPATPVRSLCRVDDGDKQRWRIGTDGAEVDVDGVVIALPARPAGRLLRAHDASLADTLDSVRYSSVAIVTMGYDSGAIGHPLDGTGFLVSRSAGGRADPLVTACTWLSSKWPELRRDGEVLLRASVGRDGDERCRSLADDELVTRCVAELGVMMGVRRPPHEALVSRWPEAFPQYDVGHLDRVHAMETAAGRLPSLALAGAALHGVGIPACIGSGRRAARAVVAAGAP